MCIRDRPSNVYGKTGPKWDSVIWYKNLTSQSMELNEREIDFQPITSCDSLRLQLSPGMATHTSVFESQQIWTSFYLFTLLHIQCNFLHRTTQTVPPYGNGGLYKGSNKVPTGSHWATQFTCSDSFPVRHTILPQYMCYKQTQAKNRPTTISKLKWWCNMNTIEKLCPMS